MLQNTKSSSGPNFPLPGEFQTQSSDALGIEGLLSAARRQWIIVVAMLVIGAALGVVAAVTAVPLYTASTDMLIDQSTSQVINAMSPVDEPSTAIEGLVLSQIELLKSENVGFDVVDKLQLADDAAFMATGATLISKIRGAIGTVVDFSAIFGSGDGDVVVDKRQSALQILQEYMDVKRNGESYVLTISYSYPEAGRAAQIAQAFADAYIADQLDSKFEATRRASGWLQQRIEELRTKSLESDKALQKFKAEKGLITASGVLVTDQNLTELNTQLTTAQSDLSIANARYARIRSLIESGDTNAVVNDALASSVINTLREKYLDASKRETDLSSRLGVDHIQAVRLRSEMSEYKKQMFDELSRIADSYQSDAQVAKARVEAAATNVAIATGASAGANDSQVQMRELEREADTYRQLYQTFLQRYQEAVQQQSFPVTQARVISRAQAPLKPSKPNKPLTVILAMLFGAAVGTGIGSYREFRDRYFRTGDQVRDELGLEFLGLAPIVKGQKRKNIPQSARLALDPEASKRFLSSTSAAGRYVVDYPLSSFAETLRAAKVAGDMALEQRTPKIIGIVSVLPGEGKSTIALNFAELLAAQGASTMLIDCDLRRPGLTRTVAAKAEAGVAEIILEERSMNELVMLDPETKLSFLPAARANREISHTAELLSSKGMTSLLAEASQTYEYIIVDLPPLAPVVDVRAIAHRIDAFIFVVEWGATARRSVKSTLMANPMIAEKCLGVILNKVDNDKMKLYRDFGSSEYYHARYTGYYHEEA